MNDYEQEQVEQLIAATLLPRAAAGAPSVLRTTILADVRRELRNQRWDRRLRRTAAALLVVGVGFNGLISLGLGGSQGPAAFVGGPDRMQPSILATATAVAEATDAQTARQFARQLAVLRGRPMTEQDAAALEAALAEGIRHRNAG